jgi:HlyD family secretion protein
MKKARLIWLVVALAVPALGYWWFSTREKPVENPYKTALIERRDVSARVTASGTLQALVTVQVGSQVSGRLQQLFADFNTRVKKGDVVARLDPQLFEASVAKSQANFGASKAGVSKADVTLKDAQRTYERVQEQRKEGLASQQEVDSAQTAVAVARASLDAANSGLQQARAQLHQDEVNLSLTVIKSPIDGVVISRAVDVGQTVAASLQAPVLFTIAEDLTKMRLEASIPESDVGKLAEGMSAQFTVDAFPGRRFRGKVSQVRNAAVTVQNVVTYTAVIAVDNPDLKLRPGMTATVTVVTASRTGVVTLPNAALRFRPAGAVGPGGGRASGSGPVPGGGRPNSNATIPGGGPPSPVAVGAGGERGAAPNPEAAPGDGMEVERKTVWRLNGLEPAPVRVAIGVSDGSFTEVMDDSLREGDSVIVEGPATAGAAPAGSARKNEFRMRGVF